MKLYLFSADRQVFRLEAKRGPVGEYSLRSGETGMESYLGDVPPDHLVRRSFSPFLPPKRTYIRIFARGDALAPSSALSESSVDAAIPQMRSTALAHALAAFERKKTEGMARVLQLGLGAACTVLAIGDVIVWVHKLVIAKG